MKTPNISKWTDNQFRLLFIVFLLLAIIPAIILIMLTRPLEDKYQHLMQTKQVYLLDPSGQKYLLSALDSQQQAFENIGKLLIKKMYTFDYKGSTDNIEFIKQYMPSELFQRLMNETAYLREEVIQTSGSYLTDVTKYYLSRRGNEYIMEIFFDHTLVSRAISSTRPFLARLTMVNSSQTQDNYSGIYLKDYELFSGDELTDEADKIENQD